MGVSLRNLSDSGAVAPGKRETACDMYTGLLTYWNRNSPHGSYMGAGWGIRPITFLKGEADD